MSLSPTRSTDNQTALTRHEMYATARPVIRAACLNFADFTALSFRCTSPTTDRRASTPFSDALNVQIALGTNAAPRLA